MASFYPNERTQIRVMPQLVDAADRGDDWTGVTCAAERRKRQNRLNSRAFRRRRAQAESQEHSKQGWGFIGSTTVPSTGHEHKLCMPYWSEDDQAVILVPIAELAGRHRCSRTPLLPYTATPTKLDRVIFPLSSDHLLTLLQYNILRACLANRDLVDRLAQPQDQESSSTALTILPEVEPSILSALLPPSLHPTVLQRTIPHSAWIDILPHPILRDNLILLTTSAPASSSSTSPDSETAHFDEDALWADTVGGLFEGFEDPDAEHVGGLVWDSPWDVSGWEVSEGFWRKYGWVLRGCEREVLQATNRWRRKRGEEDLSIEV